MTAVQVPPLLSPMADGLRTGAAPSRATTARTRNGKNHVLSMSDLSKEHTKLLDSVALKKSRTLVRNLSHPKRMAGSNSSPLIDAGSRHIDGSSLQPSAAAVAGTASATARATSTAGAAAAAAPSAAAGPGAAAAAAVATAKTLSSGPVDLFGGQALPQLQIFDPPLEEALQCGLEHEDIRLTALDVRQPLTEDLATHLCSGGASLRYVDVNGLEEDLETANAMLPSRALTSNSQATTTQTLGRTNRRTGTNTLKAGTLGRYVSEDDHRLTRTTAFGRATAASLSLSALPLLQQPSRPWPDIDQFSNFYHTPQQQTRVGFRLSEQPSPLPDERPTISRLEDLLQHGSTPSSPSRVKSLLPGSSPAVASALITAAAGANGSTAGAAGGAHQVPPALVALQGYVPAPRRNRTARIICASEAETVYRHACSQLGVPPLRPIPSLVEEGVALRNLSCDSTLAGVALAEGIRTAAPRSLELNSLFTTDSACERLMEAAFASNQLAELKIIDTGIDIRSLQCLAENLRRQPPELHTLQLSCCGIGGDIDEEEFSLLPEGTRKMYSDCPVQLYRQLAVEDKYALPDDVPLAEPVPLVKSWLLPICLEVAWPGCQLKKLDLSRTTLSHAAMHALAFSVQGAKLTSLQLNWCCLDDLCFRALAQGLLRNTSLLDLGLRGNELSGQPGCSTALLQAIGRHARLSHLDLAENLLPKEALQEILQLLRWSASLVAVHALGYEGLDPYAPCILHGCRKALHRKVDQSGEPSRSSPDRTGSSPSTLCSDGLSPKDVQEADEDEDDEEGEQQYRGKEMVLCRAVHIEGLEEWRVVAPEKVQLPPKPKTTTQSSPTTSQHPHTADPVLCSYMPPACWVCERCSMVEFKWTVPDTGPGSSTGLSSARVFVRPSFAGFAKLELVRRRIHGARRAVFTVQALAPPGGHAFIFEAEQGGKASLLTSREDPEIDPCDVALSPRNRAGLDEIFKKVNYAGPVHRLEDIVSESFKIPDCVSKDPPPPEVDPWEDAAWLTGVMECFNNDIQEIHLHELCHAEDELTVRATLRKLYHRFYEAYAVCAGTSQWPLVRQVDIYSFMDDAKLLDRGPQDPSAIFSDSLPGLISFSEASDSDSVRLSVPDVQHMIARAVQPSRARDQDLSLSATKALKSTYKSSSTSRLRNMHKEALPLTRSQFVEVLLRAAVAVAGPKPVTEAISDFAASVIVGTVMLPPLSPFPRSLHLLAGEYQDALLARRKTLREAWERFGGNAISFKAMAQLMKMCDRTFHAKQVLSIFALARRPEPGFEETPRQGLTYDEFCEAVARLAMVWRRSSQADSDLPSFPSQPKEGEPVKQKVVANRLEGFLSRLADRLKPIRA